MPIAIPLDMTKGLFGITPPVPPNDLVLPSECRRFGLEEEGNFNDLHKLLQSQAAFQPIEIKRPEDVLLSTTGLVQQKYRFTRSGLSSLCQRTAAGLARLVADLSGMTPPLSPISQNAPQSPEMAVRVINTLIRQRFETCLLDCRLVVDPTRTAIDAVVGPSYEFFSNYEWFSTCQQFINRVSEGHGEFLCAAVADRRLLLRYVDNRQWFGLPLPDGQLDTFRRGWSFSNAETGNCSARVGMVLVNQHGQAALRDVQRSRHTKALRENKGEEMLALLRAHYERASARSHRESLIKLRDQVLPIEPGLQNLQALSRKMWSKITQKLHRSIARSIVNTALLGDVVSNYASRGGLQNLMTLPSSRSYYDLYAALVSRASRYHPKEQEICETIAYELLRGKFTFS